MLWLRSAVCPRHEFKLKGRGGVFSRNCWQKAADAAVFADAAQERGCGSGGGGGVGGGRVTPTSVVAGWDEL